MKKILKTLKEYGIPGYRTGIKWKYTVASVGYIFMAIFALSYLSVSWKFSLYFIASWLIFIAIIFNFKEIHSKILWFKSTKRSTRIVAYLIFIVLFFILYFIGAGSLLPKDNVVTPTKTANIQSTGEEVAQTELLSVTKVVDGDTIDVDTVGRVRLIGIDTPETVDPRTVVQCFGIESSNKAKEMLLSKKVKLETDAASGDKDKYDRYLRYVFLEDGTNFNKLMISEGYAHEYTYNSIPYKYQTEFQEAEKQAREAGRGLWAADTCNGNTTQAASTTQQQNTQTNNSQSSDSTNSGSSQIITPPPSTNSSGFTCAGKTLCGQMTSCAEAMFYLNSCGVSRLDGDKDGTPCESICK